MTFLPCGSDLAVVRNPDCVPPVVGESYVYAEMTVVILVTGVRDEVVPCTRGLLDPLPIFMREKIGVGMA